MAPLIDCPSCGKQYPFKAALAGKKVKCKCGQVIAVPATPPPADDEQGIFDLAPDPEIKAKSARQTVMPKPPEAGPACPSCSSPLVEGSVVCTACGFNVKTGEKVKGAAAAAAKGKQKPAQPRFAGVAPGLAPKKVGPSETRSDVLKKFGILFGAIILVVAAVITMKFVGRDRDADKPALDPDDSAVAYSMKNDFPKESREWMKTDPSWVVSGMTPRQAEGRIDQWYQMGAKTVYFFGTNMAREAVIELPEDPEKRRQLFEWQEKWHGEMSERVRKDKGQKYLMIKLRL